MPGSSAPQQRNRSLEQSSSLSSSLSSSSLTLSAISPQVTKKSRIESRAKADEEEKQEEKQEEVSSVHKRKRSWSPIIHHHNSHHPHPHPHPRPSTRLSVREGASSQDRGFHSEERHHPSMDARRRGGSGSSPSSIPTTFISTEPSTLSSDEARRVTAPVMDKTVEERGKVSRREGGIAGDHHSNNIIHNSNNAGTGTGGHSSSSGIISRTPGDRYAQSSAGGRSMDPHPIVAVSRTSPPPLLPPSSSSSSPSSQSASTRKDTSAHPVEFELPRPHFPTGSRKMEPTSKERSVREGDTNTNRETSSRLRDGAPVTSTAPVAPAATSASPHPSSVAPTLSSLAANANRHRQLPIDEKAFVTDILFMWMGVESTQYFYFDDVGRRYDMVEGYGTLRQRQALDTLQSCGSMARLIDLTLKSQSVEPSFVQQSLRSAIRRQLTQYHFLVCALREGNQAPLGLGDLVVAHARVSPKLTVLHNVLTATESVKGGELVSRMQVFMQQGSQRLTALLSTIYIEAVSPILSMIVQCLTKGDVQDPFDEFFVAANPKVDDAADDYWTSKFSLSAHMLPTTVPRVLAERILLVAKNICFVRHCCRSKAWNVDPGIIAAANNASFDSLGAVVKDALDYTNSAVMTLVTDKFHLHDVLRIIDAFLLVGNGTFYEILIEKLDKYLSKHSHRVQTSVIREEVQKALQEIAPSTRDLNTDLFSLVHCEMVKDERIIGWDAFVITMPIPSPLNNVFDVTAMKIYRRLFRIMFKVKRAEVALKNSWRRSVMLDRMLLRLRQTQKEAAAWREVAADAHLLGMQLNHFVNNLWSYLVSEVSMVAWDMLMKALRRCESLDDIRVAHNVYLQHLTLHSLLHTDCSAIRQNIESILSMVSQYCLAQALLAQLLETGHGDVYTLKDTLQQITDAYHRAISTLLTTLEEHHIQLDFLNFLLLRLNFNQFYHDTDMAQNTVF